MRDRSDDSSHHERTFYHGVTSRSHQSKSYRLLSFSYRLWSRPIELFLVPVSAPQLVYQRPWYVLSCLWDDAYKRTLAANGKRSLCGGSGFPLSLSHMVKDHSDSEIGKPLPPHRLLFPNSSKGSFICI